MRWKLLVLVSLIGALVGSILWSAFIALRFASGTALQRPDWLLIATALVPLALATFAGVFVHRHTARRRKTQAVFAVLLTLLLAVSLHYAGSKLFPRLMGFPDVCNDRPCQ